MSATRVDVDRWIKVAKETDKQFIISVCDSWDYEDFPIYCKDVFDLKKKIPSFNGPNMTKINEIIYIKPNNVVVENLNVYNYELEL